MSNAIASCPPPPPYESPFDSAYDSWQHGKLPPQAERAAEALAAWLDGTANYWTRAIGRGSSPVEVGADHLRWWELFTARKKPQWSTPHEILWETPLARLRDFTPAGAATDVVPTLVLPPQAGHDSCIVDYAPHQSQMRTIMASGLERAASMDWVGATAETKDAGIEDYLEVIDRAVTDLGGRVNLVGDCQGGWLATIYTALNPESVNTLTIAGAPIDFRAGDPPIAEVLDTLSPEGDLAFYESLVRQGNGTLDGIHMLTGFIALKPSDEVSRLMDLLVHVHEQPYVDRFARFEDWFKYTQPLPGVFYLWIVRELFRDNSLVRGALEIEGDIVDLNKITCPINLLGGTADHITLPEQVFALADHVSTPAKHIKTELFTGGHLGLFMGTKALDLYWPPLLAAVREHSVIAPQPTNDS